MTRGERGSATVEFTLLLPALLLLFGVVVGGGRLWFARSAVLEASGAGARAATLARSAAEARVSATSVVNAELARAGVRCAAARIAVDTAAFGTPVGTPASVTVSVECGVPLSDVLVPGWPGVLAVSATGSSVLDPYRGRTP